MGEFCSVCISLPLLYGGLILGLIFFSSIGLLNTLGNIDQFHGRIFRSPSSDVDKFESVILVEWFIIACDVDIFVLVHGVQKFLGNKFLEVGHSGQGGTANVFPFQIFQTGASFALQQKVDLLIKAEREQFISQL